MLCSYVCLYGIPDTVCPRNYDHISSSRDLRFGFPRSILRTLFRATWVGLVTPLVNYIMTSSNGYIFRVTGTLTLPVTGEFPAQRPVTRSFDVFFDLRLNERLSKQSWGWWFETPLRPLWRYSNVLPTTGAIVMATYGANNDDKRGVVAILVFQCMSHELPGTGDVTTMIQWVYDMGYIICGEQSTRKSIEYNNKNVHILPTLLCSVVTWLMSTLPLSVRCL